MELGFIKNRGKIENYETRKWAPDRSRKNFHYGSYALSIGPRLLRSAAFLQWWKKLRITQGRNRTIRRGETGLTQWVIKHGFSHGTTTVGTDIDEIFATMDMAALRHVFDSFAYFDAPKGVALLEELERSPGIENLTREELLQYMYLAIGKGGAADDSAAFSDRTKEPHLPEEKDVSAKRS